MNAKWKDFVMSKSAQSIVFGGGPPVGGRWGGSFMIPQQPLHKTLAHAGQALDLGARELGAVAARASGGSKHDEEWGRRLGGLVSDLAPVLGPAKFFTGAVDHVATDNVSGMAKDTFLHPAVLKKVVPRALVTSAVLANKAIRRGLRALYR